MTISYDPPSLRTVSPLNDWDSTTTDAIYPLKSQCPIKPNVSLANLTSYRVGGKAQWYVAPRNLADLQASIQWAKPQGLPITLLGAGSNLLISDQGLPGLILCTRNLRSLTFNPEATQVTTGSGILMARLARQVALQGWQGLEWAIGIPGTIGGGVVMNAGAHHSCIADILVNVQVLTAEGKVEQLKPVDLGYSYRTSILQTNPRLVIEATFQLQATGNPAQVVATTNTHLKQRHATQPYHLPSCGSVFRNPEPYKAAQLIEKAGLKGYQIGGAKVSELHANFIVNVNQAKARDVYQLIRYVQQRVEDRWSIHLEPEVRILGEF